MSALNSKSHIGRWRAAVRGERLHAVTSELGTESTVLETGPVEQLLNKTRALLDKADHLLLALDFDGVLARLAPTPQEARLEIETRTILERMANVPWLNIAVLSGRGLADLSARVGVPGLSYVGNHGLEIKGALGDFRHPELELLQTAHRDALDQLHKFVTDLPGVLIEDKGAAIACHYRIAPSPVAEKLMVRVQELAEGFRGRYTLIFGSYVVELQPAINWGPEEAIRWLQGRFGEDAKSTTVFISQERNDAAAVEFVRSSGVCAQVGGNVSPRPGCIALGHVDEVREFLAQLASGLGL